MEVLVPVIPVEVEFPPLVQQLEITETYFDKLQYQGRRSTAPLPKYLVGPVTGNNAVAVT